MVTIRYWAAAREAAGQVEERFDAGDIGTLGDLLAAVRARHTDRPRLEQVLSISSFLVDEQPVGTREPDAVPLVDGARVEVLPPFAGG